MISICGVTPKRCAQSVAIITNGAADTNTIGADHPCTRALIKTFEGNAGLAWVNFKTPAVENACNDLPAGKAVSVPLENTNQINVLFKTANDKVAVTYEA